MRVAVVALPERSDQADEALIPVRLPPGGGGIERRSVGIRRVLVRLVLVRRVLVQFVLHGLSWVLFLEWEPGAEHRLSIVDRADPPLAAMHRGPIIAP